MGHGLAQISTWVGYALGCLILDRRAYQAVVKEPTMTGPALLIALVMVSVSSIVRVGGFDVGRLIADIGLWFVAAFILYGAGYALTRKGTFTKTFRAVAFAQSVYLIAIVAIIPPLASPVRLLMLVLGFVATWMAAATAHQTRGWRTLLLPVVAFLILIAGIVVFGILLAGLEFTLQGVLHSLGIQTPP
jgi:hypothetical protein